MTASTKTTLGAGKNGEGNAQGVLSIDRLAPNPTTGQLRIAWSVPRMMRVCLKVYDAAGRVAAKLADGSMKPGRYAMTWNGKDDRGCRLASGIYFFSLETDNARLNRKIILAR